MDDQNKGMAEMPVTDASPLPHQPCEPARQPWEHVQPQPETYGPFTAKGWVCLYCVFCFAGLWLARIERQSDKEYEAKWQGIKPELKTGELTDTDNLGIPFRFTPPTGEDRICTWIRLPVGIFFAPTEGWIYHKGAYAKPDEKMSGFPGAALAVLFLYLVPFLWAVMAWRWITGRYSYPGMEDKRRFMKFLTAWIALCLACNLYVMVAAWLLPLLAAGYGTKKLIDGNGARQD